MQTAETFEQVYFILIAIERIEEGVTTSLNTIKGFKEQRKFGEKCLLSIKTRITWIYQDIKFVLLSNLDALARDGRMSLQQLLQARVLRSEPNHELRNSMDLFEILFKLDQKLEVSETKYEELGLDSGQAILGLIDTSKESLESLCKTAKHLGMETSDVFYGMISDLLEKGMRP